MSNETPPERSDAGEKSPSQDQSTSTATQTQDQPAPANSGASPKAVRRPADVAFNGAALISGLIILVALFGIAFFLVLQSKDAWGASAEEVSGGQGLWSYLWPLLTGTIVASIMAMVIAVPIAIGIALFISHYAPRRLAAIIGFVIDLLAAIPSVVYGMWGATVLADQMKKGKDDAGNPTGVLYYLNKWFYEWPQEIGLPGIPFFEGASPSGRTLLVASVVLAVMILPIITSVSREVFLQTPRLHEEAALALGATKWEMIKTTVIPFGKPGVIGGTMLGLGRALGETMAVTLILSPGSFTWNLTGSGNSTIPSEIALNIPEATGLRLSELITAGLVLFALTLAVNMFARWIVERRSEFSGAN